MALKVVVIGCTGHVGHATIESLSRQYGKEHKIVAGVRDVKNDKAQALAKLPGVTVVHADMAQPATCRAALQDADSALIVVAGSDDRTALTNNTVDAAKEAKVKHIVVLSALACEAPIKFGHHFTPIEAHVKASGIPYVLLRLPFFIDNNWGNKGTIEHGAIYGPCRPDAPFTPIAVQDIADVSARVMTHPQEHVNQTYKLTTKSYTHAQLARYWSTALNKEVKYVQVPYEAAKKSMLDMGFPEWMVDGINELNKVIDSDSKILNDENDDVKKILGRGPITIQQWIGQVAGMFGPVKKLAILGTGDVAKALAVGHIKHGYEVTIGTRDPAAEKFQKWLGEIKGAKGADFKSAAGFAHTVILAVGYVHVENVIALSGGRDAFKGKVVIDPTNPINAYGPAGPEYAVGWNNSAGEQIQAWLPDAFVVKCWNVIGHHFMIDPPASQNGSRPDMWIAGNDDAALNFVKGLLGQMGWSEEHVIIPKGGIKNCRWIEPFCQAWVNYGLTTGTWKHGFAMLRW